MKNVSTFQCPLCGFTGPEGFKLYYRGEVTLHRCRRCGFVGQFLTSASIAEDHQSWCSEKTLAASAGFLYPQMRRLHQDTIRRILRRKGSPRLLDVGCGDGHFLHWCRRAGIEAVGVEYNEAVAARAAATTGAPIIRGRYEKNLFGPKEFDVITFIQVLEHLPDPRAAVEAASHHLRGEGLIVIEVPSIRSPHFLAYGATGIKWFVRPPAGVIKWHVAYYSPRTLRRLAESAGFRTLQLVTGRWGCKYSGLLGMIGRLADPLLNLTRVGGIHYIGVKQGCCS